jgi:competence protein ComEA
VRKTLNETLTRYRYVLFSIIALALAAAVGYGLAHRPPPVTLIVLPPQPTSLPTPTPTAAPLCCHVTGQVIAPGVYTLSPGAEVQDAIQAAGGASVDADLERLNLAAVVQDHQQIVVPRRSTDSNALDGPSAGLVNINTAGSETLQTLPGIGPALAGRIIDYRDAHGPFVAVEDLLNVKGIGEVTLEKLRPLISVGP